VEAVQLAPQKSSQGVILPYTDEFEANFFEAFFGFSVTFGSKFVGRPGC
jgi:hypothetical protein